MTRWLSVPVILALCGAPLGAEEVREKEKAEVEEMDPEERLEAALDKRVSFEFIDTPFTETVQFIQALAKINIVLDPKVAPAAEKKTITLRVADMPLGQALQWIVKLADLEMAPREGALFIFKPDPNPKKIGEVELQYPGVRITFDVTEADLPSDLRREIVHFVVDRMHEEAERQEERRDREAEQREKMRAQFRAGENMPPEMRERIEMMLEKRRRAGGEMEKPRKMDKMRGGEDGERPQEEKPPRDEVF